MLCWFLVIGKMLESIGQRIASEIKYIQGMKVLILLCGFLFQAGIPSGGDPGHFQQLNKLLQERYPANAPGIAIGIMMKGKTVFKKGYGIERSTGNAQLSPGTRFNIASLSKQFTAMAILQLEAAGKLRLDDPIGRYLPALPAGIGNAVTIRHLLTHASGIVDHYGYTDTAGLHHAHNQTAYDAIKNVDSVYFPAGSQFRYSNTAYCLLGLIIEHCSGLPYARYMQERVFAPAGLQATSVWKENQRLHHEAIGYDVDSLQQRFLPSGADQHIFFSTEADGGIYTTVTDFLKWLEGLQEGRIFPPAYFRKAGSIQTPIAHTTKTGYGMGWFVDKSSGKQLVYHSGSNGGFNSYSFTIPAEGFAVVIFSNRSDRNLEALVQEILHLIRPGMPDFPKILALTS